MKTCLWSIVLLAVILSSCGPEAGDAKPTADAQKGSDAGKDTAAQSDKDGTFWQLIDKADLKVVTDPWPAKAGTATLKAEITPNDDDEKFAGLLDYRISATEKNSAAWQSMPKVGEDKDKSVYFESPIKLTAGTVYIQFRVRTAGEKTSDKDALELNDWKVEVQ